jgi:RNA polymerase sigma-70 factor (ECF subfamily)
VDAKHEWDLIRKCREGSSSAFEPLVLKNQDRALRMAAALLGDDDEAADAVQDAFVKAYRSLRRLKDGSDFGAWFRTILRNGCMDRLRSPRRKHATLTEDLEAEPDLGAEQDDLAAILKRALAAISPEHREILVMKEMEGMSYAEIASVAGIAPGTVASRIYHARLALKKALLSRGITPEEVG